MPPERSPLAEVFAALDATFRDLGLRWYLFGAQAALLYGAARLTADVDVTLDAGDLGCVPLLRALRDGGFAPRVADAEAFATRTRVLPLVHTASAIPVDVVLAGPGLEPVFLARAEIHEAEGIRIPVARAEDIVTMKLLAGRPKDVDDTIAMLAALGDGLDLRLVRETLAMLEDALAQSDLLPRLDDALARARGG